MLESYHWYACEASAYGARTTSSECMYRRMYKIDRKFYALLNFSLALLVEWFQMRERGK